ncbi:MAG: glycosyltransferase [Acidobacteriota bacterium]
MRERVVVSIVTHDDASFLERCVNSLLAQSVPLRIKIFDNHSQDGTAAVARRFGMEIFESQQNLGYSRGHNFNLAGEDFEFGLLLNADVILQPDYVERLLWLCERVEAAGMAGGKLYRMGDEGQPLKKGGLPVIDSTGMFFTPALRHFDRGSEEEDRGQYDRLQSVFGISGAALFCKKKMLDDLCWRGEYLDEDFFAYREDADLAWRAKLRGWKAIYDPGAVGWHRRHATPARRRQLSPAINYHSLKNRYLMRRKNIDTGVTKKCFPYMWLRDLGIMLYAVVLEQSSLPALAEAWRLRPKFQEKRNHVQSSRRIPSTEMARWFFFQPVADDITVPDWDRQGDSRGPEIQPAGVKSRQPQS